MYGYSVYIEITPEQVLQKVKQEKIFEYVLKQPFAWNIKYNSPFRQHSKGKGTCRFEQREDGTILFVDFGEERGRTHRNCWNMVMEDLQRKGELHSLQDAIKAVCEHFGLSLSKSDYAEPKDFQYDRTVTGPPVRAEITYIPKDYNKFDIQHWSQFLIRPEHLNEDSVFSVLRYTVDGAKGRKTFTPYKHCYAIDFLSRIKIYQPYQEQKFITNFDEDCIGNINNLPPTGDELIIQKSYKDHRVVRNTIPGSNVIYLHNEGCIPSMDILYMLSQRFKLITIFFDADEAGIKAAMVLFEVFNSIREGCCRIVHMPCYNPKRRFHWKDPGEFIHKEGRLDLIEAFKQIGIWNLYPQ